MMVSNMKFKVGQRVWVIKAKKYATITDKYISYKRQVYEIEDNENLLYKEHEFHETADDMFRELGFELYYAKATDMYVYHKDDFKIYIPRFMIDDYGYQKTCSNRITNQEWFCNISNAEHLAIHQKMIELGWL